MRMFLFATRTSPTSLTSASINNGDDGVTVYHEYTHGLSGRLVTDAGGNDALRTRPVGRHGRGLERLVRLRLPRRARATDRHPAPRARWTSARTPMPEPHARPLPGAWTARSGTTNPICPGTAERRSGRLHLRRLRARLRLSRGPLRRRDLGRDALGPPPAPRGQAGQRDPGPHVAERLVTDGMRLSPPEPSFLEERNAILAADQADYGGDHCRPASGRSSPSGAWASSPRPRAATDAPPSRLHRRRPRRRPDGHPEGHGDGNRHRPAAGRRRRSRSAASPRTRTRRSPTRWRPSPARTAATRSADVPEGTVPASSRSPGPPASIRDLAQRARDTDAPAVRDAVLRRDWSALNRRRAVESVSDDTGAPFGCGVDADLRLVARHDVVGVQPDPTLPDNPHTGSPTPCSAPGDDRRLVV